MDGSDVVQITKGTNGRSNSLTIDYEGQRLYWVDFDINNVVSSDMNGKFSRFYIAVLKSLENLAVILYKLVLELPVMLRCTRLLHALQPKCFFARTEPNLSLDSKSLDCKIQTVVDHLEL